MFFFWGGGDFAHFFATFVSPLFTHYDITQHVHMISRSLLSGRMFISRTVSAKTSFTFMRFFALASTKGQPQIWARAMPSTVGTSRWLSRSTLLPTSRMGTRSVPFTRTIWSRIVLMSCNKLKIRRK